MSDDIKIEDVKRLSLKPDDVLLVKTPRLSNEQVMQIKHQIGTYFPDHRVMILTDGIEIEVAEEGGQ